MLQEEVVLLLRRQSKGFVRTSTNFRGVTKDRVSHSMACARSASACTVADGTWEYHALQYSPGLEDISPTSF